MIPAEIEEYICWRFSLLILDPRKVIFKDKLTACRSETWDMATKLRPVTEADSSRRKWDNPWRKCHTEHYWAYYLTNIGKAPGVESGKSSE